MCIRRRRLRHYTSQYDQDHHYITNEALIHNALAMRRPMGHVKIV